MDSERKERERLKRLQRLANTASNESKPSIAEARSSSQKRTIEEVKSIDSAAISEQIRPSRHLNDKQSTIPASDHMTLSSDIAQEKPQHEDDAAWMSRKIESIFKVSLSSRRSDRVHLPDLQAELIAEHIDMLSVDVVDRVILSRLALPVAPSPFDYLLDCYKSADNLVRMQSRQTQAARVEALTEIKRLCVSYAGLSVTMPDMLDTMHDLPDIAGRLLQPDAEAQGIPNNFLKELVAKCVEEDSLGDLFHPVFNKLALGTLRKTIASDFLADFAALRHLLAHPDLVECLAAAPNFLPMEASAAEFETISLLGPFLRISPIDAQVAEQSFATILDSGNAALYNSINNLRTAIPVVQDQLFTICNILVRQSASTRERLLAYFARAVNINSKRHALQVDAATVSSDGFMLNITAVLNKFANPFILDPTKLSKIEVEYLRREPLVDLANETRLAADESTTKEFYATRLPGDNNFISHIFFLNVAYHHYGLGATMITHQKLMEKVRDLQKYHDQIRGNLPLQGPTAMMATMQLKRIERALTQSKAISYSYESVLCDLNTQTNSFSFLSLVATWLIKLVDPTHEYPRKMIELPLDDLNEVPVYRNLPEYFVEDIAEYFLYVSRMIPQLLTSADVTSLVIFSLVFLRSSAYIKNPYLKAKLVEILFNGIRPYRAGAGEGALSGILNSHPFALKHLFPALMSFYIEVESTGLSSQFYDKFNIRYHISQIFKSIWQNMAHREKLELESKNDIEFFVRFVALLLNDQTYLLDEALAKLGEIHNLQIELEQTEDKTTQEFQERQQHFQQSERAAISYLQLGTETLSLLDLFTASIPAAFCTPEIVDRLAAMLDYNLEALVGPKCSELKVKDPEKYHFEPKSLLSAIATIFLNMSQHNTFVVAVAKDGRSYKKENFQRTSTILKKFNLKSPSDIEKLDAFVTTVEVRKSEYEQDEEDLGEVPDEFLDPLMGEIMLDPVILPTSKTIIDRSTIKRHLLNDATDPFNRAPLQLADVVPADDLKRQIEAFRASKRR